MIPLTNRLFDLSPGGSERYSLKRHVIEFDIVTGRHSRKIGYDAQQERCDFILPEEGDGKCPWLQTIRTR